VSEDPVIDFMVMEAVHQKTLHEEEQARKDAERKKFTRDRGDLLEQFGK
jgi:hypothetical protein